MLALTDQQRGQFAICDDQQINEALDRFTNFMVDAGNRVMRQAAVSAMESIEVCCGKMLGFNQPQLPGQELAALPT